MARYTTQFGAWRTRANKSRFVYTKSMHETETVRLECLQEV